MGTPGQFPQQRVGVFVDIQNMYYSGRALYDQKVNFKNVLEAAVAGRQLVRAFAYGITTEEAHEEEFHTALGTQGFEVKTKPLQTFIGGQKKGDWDVGIAMDVLRLQPKIDAAVLVSGDGDFVPLVQFAREHGLRVEVLAFRESTSKLLVEAVDSFIDLSSDKKRFLMPNAGRLRRRVAKIR
ncbi:MAG: NYN domain-containing protein [Candidatus Andersenbacteria bacterium]|nr:NYN domain-containing protein [Candidatus Andersenbacteria bacterium]MBI3250653.1 NYN domain-containing protein [Candidatus Andersenbacteria bacterium]